MVYTMSLEVHYGRDMRGLVLAAVFSTLIQQTPENRSGGLDACVCWDVHACMPTSNFHSYESQDQTMCLPKPYACADRPAAERVTTLTRTTCGVYLG
jgi:hypothetical protein